MLMLFSDPLMELPFNVLPRTTPKPVDAFTFLGQGVVFVTAA